jgi:hypothetical protein
VKIWRTRANTDDAGPVSDQVDGTESGVTRRDFIRKTGIVAGATVWATPVVQSVVAPAWAASGPKPPKPVCTGSDSYLDHKGNRVACGIGCKKKCPTGYLCHSNSDCQNHNCVDNGTTKVCRPNKKGGPCEEDKDCKSKNCDESDGTCHPAYAGEYCEEDGECTTTVCAGGVCKQSGRGEACASNKDCVKGLKCKDSTCS